MSRAVPIALDTDYTRCVNIEVPTRNINVLEYEVWSHRVSGTNPEEFDGAEIDRLPYMIATIAFLQLVDLSRACSCSSRKRKSSVRAAWTILFVGGGIFKIRVTCS